VRDARAALRDQPAKAGPQVGERDARVDQPGGEVRAGAAGEA